jgi:predicted aconitase with swiveling domain
MALMFGDKQVKCGDQNNADIYKKPMLGKALCLPMTIGSTTGGMVLYTACSMGKQPACMLFSLPIDSLAASGAILGDVWTDASMPVVDQLGEEFLAYVKTGRCNTQGVSYGAAGACSIEILDDSATQQIDVGASIDVTTTENALFHLCRVTHTATVSIVPNGSSFVDVDVRMVFPS